METAGSPTPVRSPVVPQAERVVREAARWEAGPVEVAPSGVVLPQGVRLVGARSEAALPVERSTAAG